MNVYPAAIPEKLFERLNERSEREWFQKPERLPDRDTLERIADEAFHASLLTEERRRPGFRLAYCSPDDFKPDKEAMLVSPPRVIRLPTPRPFTSSELNRIAPAADLTRFLVCVCLNDANSSLGVGSSYSGRIFPEILAHPEDGPEKGWKSVS